MYLHCDRAVHSLLRALFNEEGPSRQILQIRLTACAISPRCSTAQRPFFLSIRVSLDFRPR